MNLKNIFFGIILIATPFLFALLLFFVAEYYLKYKAEAAGILYKFNNTRIKKL